MATATTRIGAAVGGPGGAGIGYEVVEALEDICVRYTHLQPNKERIRAYH
ncbi:MAG: hypothetical protein ACX93T_03090 [Bacteroidota bacterium]